MAYVWNHQNPPQQRIHRGQHAAPFPSILPPLYAAEVAALHAQNPFIHVVALDTIHHPFFIYTTTFQRRYIHQLRPLSFTQRYGVARPRSNYIDSTPPHVNFEQQPSSSSGLMLSREDETLMMSFVLDESINQENPSPTDGLSEFIISRNLKTRYCNLVRHEDDEDEICVVCQDNLCQKNEKIGTLDCGHEYHESCVKKWLLQRNFCPICKATAISQD